MSDVGRSAGLMAAGTGTSRVLGVVRVSVLVAAVGANAAAADAFALANWLPNMLYMLIAGGVLNAVLVPQVVRAYRTDSGQAFVDRLLTLAGVLLVGLTVALTLAAPLVVRLVASGKDGEFLDLATVFAFWCIPQVLFYGIYTLLGQVLNARGSFGPYMWAPVVNNIVAIAALLAFIAVFGSYERGGAQDDLASWDSGKVALLAGGATLGVVAQAVVLLIPLYRSGFRYRPRRDWRGAGLGTAGRVASWTFAALVVGQLGIVAVMQVSTAAAQEYRADVAGNNAYSLAFTIFMLPHSLVTVSLLTALFTRLSHHAATDDRPALRDDFSSGLRVIGAFTVIATAVLAVLALPVVRVVLPRTEPAEAGSIAAVVVALMAGLAALGAWSLCQRVFYAYEDAKGLFWIQVAMAGVVAAGSLLGALLLPPQWWVVTAGASIAASYVLGAVWGGIQVRRRLGGTGRGALVMHAKAVASALAAVAVGWPLTRVFGDLAGARFLEATLACVLVGSVMLAVYLAGLRLLRVDDLTRLVEPLVARLGRSMGARGGPRAARVGRARASSGRGGDRVDVVVEQGTLLAGRYRLERPLPADLPGVDGWEARDQILDRRVRALVLRSGATEDAVDRAQDAARRAALVTDPRLLRVLDVGSHEGLAYTVTEPLPGRSLAELTADGPLPPEQARAVVGEAAVALEVARRRGVHHLALRPSVVRVTPTGGVVVTGLAMDGELLGHGHGDARSTTRADTVGLVALLYLALTGHWPAREGVPAHGVEVAPVADGAPVPPAELVAAVPNDLDTLCAVTLGPHDDGPHSPAELVRELEPWADVDAGVLGVSATEPPAPPPGVTPTGSVQRQSVRATFAGQPATRRPGTTPPPAIPPAVRRADPRIAASGAAAAAGTAGAAGALGAAGSVGAAGAFGAAGSVGAGGGPGVGAGAGTAARPAAGAGTGADETTPPRGVPAAAGTGATGGPNGAPESGARGGADVRRPATVGATRAPVSAPVSAAAAPPRATTTAVVPPSTRPGDAAPVHGRPGGPAPRQGGPGEEHESFDTLIGSPVDALTRKRFDPTPFVLALVGIAVVVGLFWAWNALTAPPPPIGGSDGFGDVADTPLPEEPAEGEGDPAAEPPAEEPAPAPPAPPVIASAQMLDPPPGGDNNEHPEAVGAAIDGDPATFWYTRTYKSPTYGMKPGVGYAVTLAEPATVTTVVLNVNGTGGNVEVRLTDPATPTTGDVLASGPLAPETVLTLSAPTEGQHVVLWFTALPQTADGSNRVELAEVRLS